MAVIGANNLPVALVHVPVMAVTEKCKVGEFA
jgi:hypothetical protein